MLKQWLAIALLTLLPAAMAGAAGLGGLRVQSQLGQPLLAEIDILNLTPQDASSLRVSLAPATAYQANGKRFDQALKSLTLSLEHRAGGEPYIKVRTREAVSEPYLDLLIDLNWKEGSLRRAYAALLDLPPAGDAAAGAAARSAAGKTHAAASAAAPAPGLEGATRAARSSRASRGSKKSRRRRTVAQADTAALADQATQAPEVAAPARKGRTIVPPPPRPPGSPLPVSPAKGARIVPPAPARPAAPTASDVAAGTAGSATPAVADAPTPAAAEAAKNAAAVDAPRAATPAAGGKAAAAAATSDAKSDTARGDTASTTPANGTKPAEAAGAAADAVKGEARDAGTTDAAKDATGEPAAVPAAKAPPPAAAKKAPPPLPPPAQEAGSLMGYLWLGLALLAVLLLLLYGWLWRRRKEAARREAEAGYDDDEAPVIRPPAFRVTPPAAPAPAVAAGAALAATAGAGAVSPAMATPVSMAGATQEVDPIDEAKVYIEYGQHEQAEKVLREALSRQPGREDIHMLLLEQLAKLGDKDGFNKAAARLHKQTGGVGEPWRRAAALGYALDPQHLLYSPSESSAGGEAAPAPVGEASGADAAHAADAAGAPAAMVIPAVPAATPDLVKAFVGDVPAPLSPVPPANASANPSADPAMTLASPEAAPPAAAARAAGGTVEARGGSTAGGAPAPTDAAGTMLPPLEFEFPSTPESDPWEAGTQGETVPGMQDVLKVADPVRTGDGLEFTVSLPDADAAAPQLPESQQSPLLLADSPPEAGLAFTPDLLAIETKVQEAVAVSTPVVEASSLPVINMPIEATPESLEDSIQQPAESLPKINTNLDEEAAATARERDAHWDDVEQKFSLARAYLEIHDKEGAMEVLREAEREGDPRQKAEARHMLQEIK